MGDTKESLNDIDQTIEYSNKIGNEQWHAFAFLLRGWIDLNLKNYRDSHLAFQKYYNIISKYNTPYTRSYKEEFSEAELQFNLGMLDVSAGEIDTAQQRIIKMSAIITHLDTTSQKWVNYHHDILQAELYLAENNFDSALKSIPDIGEMDFPDMHSEYVIRYLLFFPNDISARIFEKQGKVYLAIQEYQDIISKEKTYPNRQLIHPMLYYRLAALYDLSGNTELARQMYDRFLQVYNRTSINIPEVIDARKQVARLKSGI